MALFDDLELQAEGLALGERDEAVAELGRAGYSEVDLDSRLHAAVGTEVRVTVAGLGPLTGFLARVGADFVMLRAPGPGWVVRTAAVERFAGLPDGATPVAERPLTARLGLAAVLRGLATDHQHVVLHQVGGAVLAGELGRVGADFVELGLELVPFTQLAALRSH